MRYSMFQHEKKGHLLVAAANGSHQAAPKITAIR